MLGKHLNVIVKVKFGSPLHGTATPNSDLDIKGPPPGHGGKVATQEIRNGAIRFLKLIQCRPSKTRTLTQSLLPFRQDIV